MLGRLHQGDDSGCPRLPDSRTAFRLRLGECCCHAAGAIFRCTGTEANAARVAPVERTRHFRPFAGKPGTPAPCETLCCARVGVGRRCWRRGSLRDLYPSRRAAGRVSPSGRGHRSKWITRRHRGTGAGACGDTAQRANLRTPDYAAWTGCNQRWQAPSPGHEGLVSRNSWTAGIGPVGKRQKPSRGCIASVLLARRRRSNHPKTISRGGSRHHKGSELRWMFALSLFPSAQGRNSYWIVVCRRGWRERSGNDMQGSLKNYALVICLFIFLFVIIGGGLHLNPGGAFLAAVTGTPLVIYAFRRGFNGGSGPEVRADYPRHEVAYVSRKTDKSD